MYGIYKKEVLMSRSKKEMDLTVGDPFRSLLKFAIPVILGNLFQLFYTLADTMIVGKTLGAQSLAAVGSTSLFCVLFYQRFYRWLRHLSGPTLRCQR